MHFTAKLTAILVVQMQQHCVRKWDIHNISALTVIRHLKLVELSTVQITHKLPLSKYLTGIYLWNVFAANLSTTICGTIYSWMKLTVLSEKKKLDSKWLLRTLSQCLLLGYIGLHLHLLPLESLFYLWQRPKYVCKGLKMLFKVTAEITVCQKMVLLGHFYLRKIF